LNGANKPVVTEPFVSQHFITGFESAFMPGVGTDVLTRTRHNEHFRYDSELVKILDIQTIRYPAAWNYVQYGAIRLNWASLDEKLAILQEVGIIPILDLVHHTAIHHLRDRS
jgi:hypothetical protein